MRVSAGCRALPCLGFGASSPEVLIPPRAAGAKWADVVKPPGSPSRGDGGLGVLRGCYSESRGEAELAEGQTKRLWLCLDWCSCIGGHGSGGAGSGEARAGMSRRGRSPQEAERVHKNAQNVKSF